MEDPIIQPPQSTHSSPVRRAIGVVLLFLAGLWFGWWLRGSPNQLTLNALLERMTRLGGSASDVAVFQDVWKTIEENYVEQPVGASQLVEGAIAGMVANLRDPYSVYFDKVETARFKEEIHGNFEGIGAEVGLKDNALVVIAPLPDSPAARSGLRAQDRILAIDHETTAGLTLDAAVEKLRGPTGSTVLLTIQSKDEDARDVEVTRDVIVLKSVTVVRQPLDKSDTGLAIMRITSFSDSTTNEVREAVNDLVLNRPGGIILDVRNNPGGYLQSAVDVAGVFLPDGSTVLYEQRGNDRTPSKTTGKGELASIPTVILINGGTASAAEILAGALRDDVKAKLVGEATFGKGSVQNFVDLRNESSLKLTVARWLTPAGISIDHEGLKPDVEVKSADDPNIETGDPQLDQAVELLKTLVQ